MAKVSKNKHWVESEETAQMRIEQAQALRKKVAEGSGLSFETYLTPDQAEWILEKVEKGLFVDPCEAVFVIMQEAKELEPHKDLRDELLRRSLQEAEDDPRPPIPGEEVFARLSEKMRQPRPETVIWQKIDNSKHDLEE